MSTSSPRVIFHVSLELHSPLRTQGPPQLVHQLNIPTFLFLYFLYILCFWAQDDMLWVIPLISLGQLSWLCPVPVPWATQLLTSRALWGIGKSLMLWKHCSNASETSLCYNDYFNQKYKTQNHTDSTKKISSIPSKTMAISDSED